MIWQLRDLIKQKNCHASASKLANWDFMDLEKIYENHLSNGMTVSLLVSF